ncbi:hypothetical protein FACS1894152_4950 [Bacilli bacterium]|nr:hypothetical protein FACS1894152_4950 [Bacilli bacterium]
MNNLMILEKRKRPFISDGTLAEKDEDSPALDIIARILLKAMVEKKERGVEVRKDDREELTTMVSKSTMVSSLSREKTNSELNIKDVSAFNNNLTRENL